MFGLIERMDWSCGVAVELVLVDVWPSAACFVAPTVEESRLDGSDTASFVTFFRLAEDDAELEGTPSFRLGTTTSTSVLRFAFPLLVLVLVEATGAGEAEADVEALELAKEAAFTWNVFCCCCIS